ncbi:MAG: protease modulator HflC [Victivallales bacterium]|nr:protease modulator HflC [Victivallales bacterium]
MSDAKQKTVTKHWPVVLLALVVVAIFLVVMMTFQVKETEFALLKTYSGELIPYEAGLHFRWPFINSVWRHDKRVQCYELAVGHDEQYMTSDNQQIVVSTYVLWKVADPEKFLRALDSTEAAERKLSDEVRGTRASIISRYSFASMVAESGDSSTLTKIEDEMLASIHDSVLNQFGIEIIHIGFRQLGFPAAVTQNVYSAMIAERQAKAKKFEDEGMAEAEQIRSTAETAASKATAEAEAIATKIRGEADRQAAEHYRVFAENPDLAIFLRNLDALRVSLGEKDTLILDTRTPPYNLLAPNALETLPEANLDAAAPAAP